MLVCVEAAGLLAVALVAARCVGVGVEVVYGSPDRVVAVLLWLLLLFLLVMYHL